MRPLDILIARPIHEPSFAALRAMPGVRVDIVGHLDQPRALPSELARGKQVMFGCYMPTNLDEMTALRFVQIDSVGYDHILGAELPRRGIAVANGLGVLEVPIAEWTMAMMIALARDLRRMMRNQDDGHWDRDPRFQREIRGLTVGIWGYGGIGRQTARLAKAMGLRVHVLARSGVGPRTDIYCVPGTGDPEGRLPDVVFTPERRHDFLASLDFLVMAMPMTGNRGIVGEDDLRALRPSAFVLNPARGPLIQEAALIRALREGWIAGAALDTHYQYPLPADHPLWSMPNVIMTPHISGSNGSPYTDERIWDVFLQNVRRFRDGAPLLNRIAEKDLRAHAQASVAGHA
jgi:phosphoglycerate dehydrogenase-like enzyme